MKIIDLNKTSEYLIKIIKGGILHYSNSSILITPLPDLSDICNTFSYILQFFLKFLLESKISIKFFLNWIPISDFFRKARIFRFQIFKLLSSKNHWCCKASFAENTSWSSLFNNYLTRSSTGLWSVVVVVNAFVVVVLFLKSIWRRCLRMLPHWTRSPFSSLPGPSNNYLRLIILISCVKVTKIFSSLKLLCWIMRIYFLIRRIYRKNTPFSLEYVIAENICLKRFLIICLYIDLRCYLIKKLYNYRPFINSWIT